MYYLPVALCPAVPFDKGHHGLLLVVVVVGLAASCGYPKGIQPVVLGVVWFVTCVVFGTCVGYVDVASKFVQGINGGAGFCLLYVDFCLPFGF